MKKLPWLFLFVGVSLTLLADDYDDENLSEVYDGSESLYGDEIQYYECRTRHARPSVRFRYFHYDNDPTDELTRDASWPGRREDFSDQLFR